METIEKMERLNAAAEKATATVNRAQNWEANRNNAAARLFAINAANVILSYDLDVKETTDEEKAKFDTAFEYLHTQFIAQFNAQVKARAAFEASFSAIKNAATPQVLANAVNARGFQFDAAIRGCYQAIKSAERAERAENWAKVTAERAERAEKKGKNARKRAAEIAQ